MRRALPALMTMLLASVLLAPPTIIVATRTVPGPRSVALAPAPTGDRFAVCYEDGSVAILEAKSRKKVREFAKHPQVAMAVAWSKDGNYLATGDESGRVWVEDVRTGAKVKEYRTHTRGVQKVSFDPTRRYVLSDGRDDFVRIYDLTSPKPKERLAIAGEGSNFYGAAFSPKNPNQFIVGLLAPSSRVYDATTGKVVGFLTGQDAQGSMDADYNATGTRAITGGKDANAVVYDATKGFKKIATLKGHTDWIVDTAYSPDGRFIATSSADGTVKLWNAYNYQKVADLPEQEPTGSALAFTGDGRTLVTVNSFGHLQLNDLGAAAKKK